MTIQVSVQGSKSQKIKLNTSVFGCEFNGPLVHQVVTAYLAAARAGTKAQKTRSEVRGGGIKPWKQKGTGRARAGTIRSPLWRKGGKVFAAQPRSFDQKVNRKMYKGALRAILSELLRTERMIVVEQIGVESPKTKGLLSLLASYQLGHKTLIIAEAVNENLYLAARNVAEIAVCDAAAVDPVSLINAEKVLITVAALNQLEESLK